MMQPFPQSARLETLKIELGRAADEYTDAKTDFERVRVTFEVARGRFARTKDLAMEMMSSADWWTWQNDHTAVKFAAAQIGDAIKEVLRDHAWNVALTLQRENTGSPLGLDLDSIIQRLESGGFEFRSTAPSREANAALINLSGVTKGTDSGLYYTDELASLITLAKEVVDKEKEQLGHLQ